MHLSSNARIVAWNRRELTNVIGRASIRLLQAYPRGHAAESSRRQRSSASAQNKLLF